MQSYAIVQNDGDEPIGEWRVAPRGEPLASCAFDWPRSWSAQVPEWSPPPLHGGALLLRLVDPEGDGALEAYVLRFGVEVDGLSALCAWRQAEAKAVRWNGLPLVEARLDGDPWAVVHAGPSVFALRATGSAVAHLPKAARSWRGLSGLGPIAEALTPWRVGPLGTQRLRAWSPIDVTRALPHGHSAGWLALETPAGVQRAWLHLHVIDRRVFPGVDPRVALKAADQDLVESGVELGERTSDPGPSGPAASGPGRLGGQLIEHRRALRQIGPALVVADAISTASAPIARFNARRHLDIVLALGEQGSRR